MNRLDVRTMIAAAGLLLVGEHSTRITGIRMPVDGGITAQTYISVATPRYR